MAQSFEVLEAKIFAKLAGQVRERLPRGLDAVRCAKLAMDRGMAGPLLAPSSYFMKSPSVQYHDSVAHDNVEAFIADDDQTAEDLAQFLAG